MNKFASLLVGAALMTAGAVSLINCSDHAETTTAGTGGNGTSASGGAAGMGGSSGTLGLNTGGSGGANAGTGGTDAGSGGFMEIACAGKIYLCGNGLDDDGDGKTDHEDPDCLGPCDNNEEGLLPKISGGTNSSTCKKDCYFDGDSGGGTDGCEWDHRCDSLNPGENNSCAYEEPIPNNVNCPESQATTCLELCKPLVPNGCDCFGCCEFGNKFLWIGTLNTEGVDTCTIEKAKEGDLSACQECTPQIGDAGEADCYNRCGHCELCIGKDTVPADCPIGGGGAGGGNPDDDQCDEGITPCGRPGQAACGSGEYCTTGCCIAAPR